MKEAQAHNPEVKWHFNPPRAPNFGGLWEAGVKSAKKLLKKMRLDELVNVTSDVEEVETEDELVITPGHFLVQRPLKAPPTSAPSTAKISSLRRWQLVKRNLSKHGRAATSTHYSQDTSGTRRNYSHQEGNWYTSKMIL